MKNKNKILLMMPGAIESQLPAIDEKTMTLLTAKRAEYSNMTYLQMIDDTAIIRVVGPMMMNPGIIEQICLGYISYRHVMGDIKNAINDPKVQQIVLDFDSPGGESSEMFELARYIKSASATKPVYGWVGSMAASAAYGLASACTKIFANPAAEIGSVGTMMIAAHQENPDQQGNRYIQITATDSPLKNADPTSETGLKTHQSRLDAINNQFIELLSEFRGVTTDFIKSNFGGGAMFSGREAVDRKMIDGTFNTFDECLESITKQGGKNMPTTNSQELKPTVSEEKVETQPVETPTTEPAAPAPDTPAEQPAEQPAAESIDTIRASVIADERARCQALTDMATAGKVSAETLGKAIQSGMSPEEFSKDLVASSVTTEHINTRSTVEPSVEESHSKNVDSFAALL